jgi:hypothetical protein
MFVFLLWLGKPFFVGDIGSNKAFEFAEYIENL